MEEDELLGDLRRRMDGAVEVLRKEFGGLRTGRASASLLEPITVPAYGGNQPLNQLANISVPEPRMITVNVWDRSLAKAVDKAIRESGLGLNPQTEGQVIRVPVAHGEGNYIADGETIARLEGEGRVVFRYSSPDGMIDPDWNHNGAINAIAGIVNGGGNVLGMMPHPENHVEAIVGNTDGRGLFAGLVEALDKVA